MKASDIKIGSTYIGGKNGDRRTVTGYGSSRRWICWAPTQKRLPLGAFMLADTRCTTIAQFAKWATEEERTA